MHRTQLLCAMGVVFWSTVAACSQAAEPVALTEALRAVVKNERFDKVTSIRGLPIEYCLVYYERGGIDHT